MTTWTQIILSASISLLLCLLSVPVFRARADKFGLIDEPGGRKQHTGRVPIVGGVAVYLSVLVAGAVLGFDLAFFLPLLVSLPIVIVGVLDDRSPISTSIRIPLQIFCASAMIFFGGIQITNVGDISGTGPVLLFGLVAFFFTVICTVGVINAVNMIDGVDGLSGSLIAMTFLPVTYYALASHDLAGVALLSSLIAAILGFLFYNSRMFRGRASVFLGDTGSTFLGFILVWHLIECTQGPNAVLSPVSAGWILGLPLADTIAVVVRRVINKHSPLAADRTHFHHRLLDAGFCPNKTVLIMLSVQAVLMGVGIIGNNFKGAEPMLFWAFVFLTVAHFIFTPRILNQIVSSEITATR